MQKPILHLNLTKKWFDMIESEIKKEEYRERKPHWDRIFSTGRIKIKGKYYHPSDVITCFSNGYAKDRRQMFFELKHLVNREGKEEWGAKKGEWYYCLLLGSKTETTI